MAILKATSNDKSEDILFEVSTGNLKLLTSGFAFSIKGEPIKILIDDIFVEFIFIDKDSELSSVKHEVVTSKSMKVLLTNFENSFGEGIVEPTNYLYTNHFNIFLSFFVITINKKEKHRQLSYAVYYGERNE